MSATTPGQPAGPDRCLACRSPELTRLAMVLTDGTDVTFVSCNACERREWLTVDAAGGWASLPISDVLARSARPRR